MGTRPPVPDEVFRAWARALEGDQDKLVRAKALVVLLQTYPHAQELAQQLLEFTYAGDKVQSPGVKAVVANLIFHANADPLDLLTKNAFHAIPFELTGATLAALRRSEDAGRAKRCYDGGNLLHHYASIHDLAKLRILFRQNQCHPDWINQGRTDGMTPVMVMWNTFLNQYSKPDQMWETTRLFLENGADLWVTGRNGMTLAGLMDDVRQMHKAYVFDLEEEDRNFVLGTMEALRQQSMLREQTPSPQTAPTRSRL